MKRSSWIAVILILVTIGAVGFSRSLTRRSPSDEEQIHALLVKGETSIEKKDLKAAMSCVSRSYSAGDAMKYDTLRMQAIQAFQQDGDYSVALENTRVSIAGNEADVSATVTISLVTQSGMHRVFSNLVSMHLTKEDVRRWIVLHSKVWKIVRMDGVSADIAG